MLNLKIKDCSREPHKDCPWEKERLNCFRQRVLAEKTLKSRTDDEFLLSFLRGRKFDEDDAVRYLKRYYDGKKRYPFVFKDLFSPAVKELMDRNVCCYLENTDGNGRVIIAGIARHWDPAATSVWDAYRYFVLLLEALLTDSLVQTNGIVLIVDFRQVGWRHFLHFTPNFLYVAQKCMVGCYPINYKQVHLIVGKKFAYWFTTTVLVFCPQKLRERAFVHTEGFELLHKEVGRQYLPSDFGGDLPPFDTTHCVDILKEGEEYFKECESHWTCDKD